MSKKTLEQIKQEYKDYGFEPSHIEIAYKNVDGNSERIVEEIFRLQAESQAYTTKPGNPMEEDAQMSKAIEESMKDAKDKNYTFEPLNPQQRLRKSGVPVGLKNIGNTCYFNSLLQTYFQNTAFAKAILAYQIPKKYVGIKDEDIQRHSEADLQFKRKLSSCRLVDNLKSLFCSLIASDRKYIDPSPVISSIVDNYGNQLSTGEQKDIGQFNLIFLSRIQDGLEEARQQNTMEVEKNKQEKEKEFQQNQSKINSFGGEQSSLLRRSSIRVNQQSIIAEQFLGKIQHTFINEKEHINKSEEELFNLLFLHVKHRDLYRACEEITISHIDDYRNQKGEVIGVEKHSWIKEPPKTLFFQIDRVTYDKQTLTPQKVNDLFDFPTLFYIDPFLLKNRQVALKLQKSVRSLRQEKEKYLIALEMLYKYGDKQLNLLEILGETEGFLKAQSKQMQVQNQADNPSFIPELSKQIKPQFVLLLGKYKEGLGQRELKYKERIDKIDKEIQKAYRQINNTPYHLYSLLIHEGGAESGHYYSYIFDQQSKKWRKYNDLNITEELEQQVLKEGKGVNVTSAYYLVYAQQNVLQTQGIQGCKLSYGLSNQQSHMKDQYSQFLTPAQKGAVRTDNEHLYYEIENYRMNSFATRVVETYAKKFQTFNEIFRKTKIEKKKNQPPVLTSLPVFIRSVDQEQYKNTLLHQAILEYGPKEASVIFDDLLKKKLSSFHDFKRPKKFQAKQTFVQVFISDYYFALAARILFQSIAQGEYSSVFTLFRYLLRSDIDNYFNWFARTFLKIFVVQFMTECDQLAKEKPDDALQRLKMVVIIFGKYVNREQEKMLYLNVLYWINEILVDHQHIKTSVEQILQILDSPKYEDQYTSIQNRNEFQFSEIEKSVDLGDALWNSSRQENTVIDAMMQSRERVKGKLQPCNKLYTQMKKSSVPLNRVERQRFLN